MTFIRISGVLQNGMETAVELETTYELMKEPFRKVAVVNMGCSHN